MAHLIIGDPASQVSA